jgi:hypothetical protein
VTYLGDVVAEHGCLLSAISVEDPTAPGKQYQPEPGKKLIGVEIIVGDVSGDILNVNPFFCHLVDSEGFTYEPELGGQHRSLPSVALRAGEKIGGWVDFEVPETAVAASLWYLVDPLGESPED